MMTPVDGAGGLNGKIRWIRIASGAPTRKDAGRHLAESTVKIHLKTILRKIHVRNRTQAAVWAMQHVNGGEVA